MRRLWSLRLTRCKIHSQSGGIVDVTAIALVAIAISKQPVHLGGVSSGASLLMCWPLVNKASGCNREKFLQRFGKG